MAPNENPKNRPQWLIECMGVGACSVVPDLSRGGAASVVD